jgi:hypothetical protein
VKQLFDKSCCKQVRPEICLGEILLQRCLVETLL